MRPAPLSVRLGCAIAIAAPMLVLAGCRGETSHDPPIVPIRNMYNQPRYDIQSESEFFADKRTMREPVEGTISTEQEIDERVSEGLLDNRTGYVMTIPEEVVERSGGMPELIDRGESRFNIYCVPCHDRTGSGDGMAVKRGMSKPPSLHAESVRTMPDGKLYATISHGVRNMPAYGPQIPIDDRWAIVAYVRALEISKAQLASEAKP